MSVAKWPDFDVERIGVDSYLDQITYAARTDTGRPITPVFTKWVSVNKDATDEEIRDACKQVLEFVYARAHPNGCPVRH